MRIINNVMKLQSGGEPKRVRYISAPGRNINRGIGDPDRVTSVGDEIAKAREWEANWYKGRKATGKFEDQLDDTTYNFMIDRITNSPITVVDGTSYRGNDANGTNYVGPIDDVGGHVIKIDYNKKGKLTQISQDMWKFNPRDYAKRWSGDNVAEGVRATKQAALMDKVGTPFILQQENPIYIGSRRVWDSIKSIPKNPYIRRQPLMQGALLTMKKGGSLVSDGRRFKFKDSPPVRNSRTLNNKRDMRKKFMKSDRPTYSTNRVRKGQDGLQFVSYTPVETPDIPKFESSDVFSTYNIPIVRDESVVSQPKVDEPRIDEPIIESAVNTPMKRELFNIKPSKGLDEFNKWYDEVEKEDPEAKHYRQFLTKMAEQESGFNSAIQNRAGAPAYGYFQFMQDGKKYNNITAYAGTDIETFRNNPKLQIKAAIKLAKSFERGFNKKDLELAAQKGYTKFGLLGGAWLAGNGGVRKYLQGLANPSDRHWSKSGSGTDVASRIQMFNF